MARRALSSLLVPLVSPRQGVQAQGVVDRGQRATRIGVEPACGYGQAEKQPEND
jgi:hypothetical protein